MTWWRIATTIMQHNKRRPPSFHQKLKCHWVWLQRFLYLMSTNYGHNVELYLSVWFCCHLIRANMPTIDWKHGPQKMENKRKSLLHNRMTQVCCCILNRNFAAFCLSMGISSWISWRRKIADKKKKDSGCCVFCCQHDPLYVYGDARLDATIPPSQKK